MDSGYKAHLFICTNQKDGKKCCADKNGEKLQKKVKEIAKERWGKQVRINKSGCLDRCSEGIAAVLYPQGEWFVDLENRGEDVELLVAAVEAALNRK